MALVEPLDEAATERTPTVKSGAMTDADVSRTVFVVSEVLDLGGRCILAVFANEALAIERATELGFLDGGRSFEVQVWRTDGSLHGSNVVFATAVSA